MGKITFALVLSGVPCLVWHAPQVAACPPNALSISAGKSIQEAVEKAGVTAVLCLKAGVHRMQTVKPQQGQSFQAEEGAIMSGARILSGFQRQGSAWGVSHEPLHERRFGQCATGFDNCNLPNRVFINDKPLRRVLSKSDLRPGSFFVDNELGKLFIADNPEGKIVEESIARFAFQSAASGVSIKGLVVEKYASPAQDGAINGKQGANWTVEDSEIRFNSGAGVSLGLRGRILHSNIHHNGQIGAVMVGTDVVFKANELWANNVSGFDSHWEGGGIKIGESDGVIMADNYVHHNIGPGLWCDINCRNVVYEGNRVEYNQGAGIFHEISFKAVIRNNTARYNGLENHGWYWGADIQIAASEEVEVYNNNVTTRNGGTAIVLIDQSRERTKSTKYKTRNNYIHHNNILFDGLGNVGGVSDATVGDENYSIINTGGNSFDFNIYRINKPGNAIFFAWGHINYDWDDFRRQEKQEQGGQFITF